MSEAGEFTWNFRFVRDDASNGGEPWFALKEVQYENGKPVGYGDPCLGGESIEEIQWLTDRWSEASAKPVLDVSEFDTSKWSNHD